MLPKIRPAQSHKSSVAANSPPLRIRTRRPKRPKRPAAAVHAEPLKRAPRQLHKRRLKAHVNAAKTDKRSAVAAPRDPRSEEHTSELQSRGHLVCRLLLEKKKDNYQ